MNTNVTEYVQAFRNRQPYNTQGLCARIIRGKNPADFATLSDDPDRKLIMLVGPDGLKTFLSCPTDRDMLVAIGYEPTYLIRKVEEGNQFKLVVFPQYAAKAKLATWDGVAESVAEVYPDDIASRVRRMLPKLKRLPTPATPGWKMRDFERWERRGGADLSEVDKVGKTHPRYMTEERFRIRRMSVRSAREFLYFSLHLRELYGGDGYIYDIAGRRGMTEYFCPNMNLANIDGHAVLDLNITLDR